MADRIAVIGAGQMGNGIAHVCAAAGLDVTMIDVSREALAQRARDDREEHGAPGAEGRAHRGRAHGRARRGSPASEFIAAAKNATVVIEAASENADLKFKLFEELDRIAPRRRDPRHATPAPSPSPRSPRARSARRR